MKVLERTHPGSIMEKGQRFTSAVLFVVLAAALSCTHPASPSLPNILLITFDTLRADHLGCYGYERNTSPRLDAFAETATRYTRAMAASPWTIPTHASLFTGKYPFEHGAHAFKTDSTAKSNANRLSLQQETLAEALLGEGYDTGGFVANAGYLAPVWQLNQGFGEWEVKREFAGEVNEKALAWVSRFRERPFLLFINYIDTHRPYNTTPRPGFLPEPAVQDGGELLDRLYEATMPAREPPPPGLVRKVVDQYDTAIANVDEQFGNLIDSLRAMGLYDDTMIIATSDHGEFFGEHFLVEHSKDVYQEVVWTPLLIKYPGENAGRVVETVTSSVDIPGLILAQLPQDVAARHLATFPNLPGNHPVISQLYLTRVRDLFNPVWGHRFNRVRTALFEWPYKFIHSTDGHHELYDLERDPTESRNLVRENLEVGRRLFSTLRDYKKERESAAEPEDVTLTEEQLEQLRSLGYTGN
jgi:arylsulfatase A-like enzyme